MRTASHILMWRCNPSPLDITIVCAQSPHKDTYHVPQEIYTSTGRGQFVTSTRLTCSSKSPSCTLPLDIAAPLSFIECTKSLPLFSCNLNTMPTPAHHALSSTTTLMGYSGKDNDHGDDRRTHQLCPCCVHVK